MIRRKFNYSIDGYINDIAMELTTSDKVKISDESVNTALMIAMNYLIENMEIDKQESAN